VPSLSRTSLKGSQIRKTNFVDTASAYERNSAPAGVRFAPTTVVRVLGNFRFPNQRDFWAVAVKTFVPGCNGVVCPAHTNVPDTRAGNLIVAVSISPRLMYFTSASP